MAVNSLFKETSDNDLHNANVPSQIDVRADGIIMLVKELQL